MKKYACPYCNEKLHRDDLVKHLEKEHDDEIPPHYTAYRVVYDLVNDKHGHGDCTICHNPTKWNEKRQKYERLCGSKKCFDTVRKTYENRMLRVYNKTTLLDDPQFQEKMLANRRISGEYKWSDGTKKTFTGSYEHKLLEFLDKTLEYRSDEILSPGPILQYDFNGKQKSWITDVLIIPYNLIIEVKDGGDNKNNAIGLDCRQKTLCKEKMITNMGTFNYLRLTNNNFGQLLMILAELKKQVNDNKQERIYRIHESLWTNGEFMDAQYEVAKKITDSFLQYIDENYNEYPLSFLFTNYRTIDNPDTDEELIECINVSPVYKHLQSKQQFGTFIENAINDLKSKYFINEENQLSYYFNNNNILDGCVIGLKTSM